MISPLMRGKVRFPLIGLSTRKPMMIFNLHNDIEVIHMARKKRTFAWSPIRAFMKKAGAEMVAREAVEELIWKLEELTKSLTDKTLTFARHAGRRLRHPIKGGTVATDTRPVGGR